MTDKTIHIPKLKGSENYTMWAIRVRSLLTREDFERALESDSNQSKNKRALGTICLLCNNGPLMNIKDSKSVKEAWDKL